MQLAWKEHTDVTFNNCCVSVDGESMQGSSLFWRLDFRIPWPPIPFLWIWNPFLPGLHPKRNLWWILPCAVLTPSHKAQDVAVATSAGGGWRGNEESHLLPPREKCIFVISFLKEENYSTVLWWNRWSFHFKENEVNNSEVSCFKKSVYISGSAKDLEKVHCWWWCFSPPPPPHCKNTLYSLYSLLSAWG